MDKKAESDAVPAVDVAVAPHDAASTVTEAPIIDESTVDTSVTDESHALPTEPAAPTTTIPPYVDAARQHTLPLKWLVIGLIVLVNVGLVGGNGYLAMHPKQPVAATTLKTPKATASSASSKPTTTQAKTTATIVTDTLHYVSEPMKVEFDYPVDWRISGNTDNTQLTMTSSPFQFTDATGNAAVSTVNMTIYASTTDASGLAYDGDYIAADSEPLSYSNPTAVQRKQTHLSFEAMTDQPKSAIDLLFVSGAYVYHAGQTVGAYNHKTVNPSIEMYIDGCYGRPCQALITAPFTLDNWHTTRQLQQVKSIIQSLRLN